MFFSLAKRLMPFLNVFFFPPIWQNYKFVFEKRKINFKKKTNKIPPRHPDQVFVARFQESPRTMKMWFGVDLKKFGGNFVNWTMTYRRDADVFCPYLKWNTLKLGNPREEESKMDKILSKKSRVAVCFTFFL